MRIVTKILIGIFVLIVGVLIGLFLPYKWNSNTIDEVALFPFDEQAWHKMFDIINSTLLLITLLTAIFKEQILDSIYHAKFEVKKENDYREMVENTDMGWSKASCYEKVMSVQNIGNRPALNCRLILDRVSVKSESDYFATELDIKEAVILPLSTKPSYNQLKPRGSLSFSIFRILPKVINHEDIPERPMLFQIGDNEIEIKHCKTDYMLAFHIEAEDAQSSISNVIVHWNGEWRNRKTEMTSVLSVEHL